MKIDRPLLREKTYIMKEYATRILVNAEHVETLSRSRKKDASIVKEIIQAAEYIDHYAKMLNRMGSRLRENGLWGDAEETHKEAAAIRELDKLFPYATSEKAPAAPLSATQTKT